MRRTRSEHMLSALPPIATEERTFASLARPGGNVTGLSQLQADLAGKRLELLRELLPDVRRLAVLANVAFAGAVQETEEVRLAAGKFGLEVVPAEIRRAEDLAPAFDAVKGRRDDRCRLLCRDRCFGSACENDIDLEPDKLSAAISA